MVKRKIRSKNHSRIPVNYFHLGANPTIAITENNEVSEFEKVLANFKKIKTHSPVVSTIEPRKQHAAVLEAFEKLWNENVDANLVFVGKEGWMVEDLINKMNVHPELNKRFFWFSGISDNQLNLVYKASDCLICASAGEGFGLPIIEAAQHSLPVIARDIPVFREVGKDYVYYFFLVMHLPSQKAIKEWISLKKIIIKIPKIEDLGWLTWSQSTEQLISAVLEKCIN
ncbi:glycosyltransferase [Escherichia coli]